MPFPTRGGLELAIGGSPDNVPHYQQQARQSESSQQSPHLSFAKLDPFTGYLPKFADGGFAGMGLGAGTNYEGVIKRLLSGSGDRGDPPPVARNAGPMSIHGAKVDPGTGAFGTQPSDPKVASMDPLTRAINEINERYKTQSSISGAQNATMSIMARNLHPNMPTLDRYGTDYLDGARRARGYADGGNVEDDIPASVIATGGATAAMSAFLRARHLNSLVRPLSRAMSKPVLGIESVAKHPISGNISDARYNLAREMSQSPYKDLPVERGQGAWEGDHGMEFNPLYMQELPRSLGGIKRDRKAMEYASQLGETLEQVATPVSRFVPHLFNTPEGANAMMLSGITNAKLRDLSERAGSDWVTAHRPGHKAMMFPLDDSQSLEAMAKKLGVSPRYGRSDADIDRVLLSREPLGYESGLYSDYGAVKRGEGYDAFERNLLSNPRVRKGRSWLNDLGLGAK